MLQVTKQEEEVYKLVRLVQDECIGAKLEDIINGIKQNVDKFHASDEERYKRFSAWINGIDLDQRVNCSPTKVESDTSHPDVVYTFSAPSSSSLPGRLDRLVLVRELHPLRSMMKEETGRKAGSSSMSSLKPTASSDRDPERDPRTNYPLLREARSARLGGQPRR